MRVYIKAGGTVIDSLVSSIMAVDTVIGRLIIIIDSLGFSTTYMHRCH